MENEKTKIENKLKIPVEKIVIFPEYIEVYSSEQNIGSIPYIVTPGNIFVHDTSNAVLTTLRWTFIYSKNKEDILKLITELLNVEEDQIEITYGTFRNLYVKDLEENLISGITCSYENDEWSVEKTN